VRTIVVLGMHRSGTSAITRALGLLGAEMGPADRLGRHWENKHLRNVNARLLKAGGGAWDSPPAGEDWLSTVDSDGLPELAKERIAEEFGDAEVSVWKDPRTCLTMPFWRPLMGDDPVVVLIHRHPYEVAGSLEARNQFAPGLSFALWERYNADALRFSRDLPTSVIKYADVVGRPHEVMVELAVQLRAWGIDLPNDPATTDMELEASERHHVADSDHELDQPVATPSQRALFDTLAALDGPHVRFQPPDDLPEPHPLSREILLNAGKLRRVKRRRDANEADTSKGNKGNKANKAKAERKAARRSA
jgi:hypothetical protein